MSKDHHNNLRITIDSMSNETSHFLTAILELEHWQNNYVLYEDDLFRLADTGCDLLVELCEMVETDIPLGLRAHITQKMVDNADVIIGYTPYPHNDACRYGRGWSRSG